MNRLVHLCAAGVVLLAAAGPSHAQPSSGGARPQVDLATALHLRPDQMGALAAMKAAQQPRPDELNALKGVSGPGMASLTTPARLDRINAFLNAQLQVFHRTADATRAFYGQLSPDQQRTFDQITARPSGGAAPAR